MGKMEKLNLYRINTVRRNYGSSFKSSFSMNSVPFNDLKEVVNQPLLAICAAPESQQGVYIAFNSSK